MNESTQMTGLQISFEKGKEFATNIKVSPKFIKIIHGQTKKENKFKHTGEIVQSNGVDTEAN